jgi:methylglutaconyl-CoA hydratase
LNLVLDGLLCGKLINRNMDAYVSSTIVNGINTIEFFHPQSNSLPANILQQLAQTINTASTDSNTKVIILKSAGDRTFCAGASFDELMAATSESEGLAFFSGFANVINAMRQCPKFIIGVIQGKAIGGGVGLACSCDYTLATTFADVKLSELAVGIGPFVVGPAVERKIGTQAAYELAIDATNFRTAQWAKEKGLYANLFDSIETMHQAAIQLATTLSLSNPEAMAAIKKAFWSGTDHWDTLLIDRAKISGKLVLSDFTRNAINQFKKK